MSIHITSNGSKFAGQAPDSIDQLVKVLETETLDPEFEMFGNFSEANLDHETGINQWRVYGNFLNLSHVFNIGFTITKGEPKEDWKTLCRLGEAIRKNQEREEYVQARLRRWPRLTMFHQIGQKNPWISQAYDPPFNMASLAPCYSFKQLADRILGHNWALGVGFFCDEVCLINQTEGGGEFLVIKEDCSFESFSVNLMGKEKLIQLLEDIHASSVEECRALEYNKHRILS